MSNYTTQCTDQTSGKVGCFFYDVEKFKATGKFYATGPVYDDLVSFYNATNREDRHEIAFNGLTKLKAV